MLYDAPAATFNVQASAEQPSQCPSSASEEVEPTQNTSQVAPLAALTFKTMSSSTLAYYLNDLIQTAVPVRPLRSSNAPLLSVPRTPSEFVRRAFSVAAPHT